MSMHAQKLALLGINVLGGIAVLGSYVWGLSAYPESSGAVWGGVPEGLKPLYTVNMLAAAVGYFAFTYYLFFQVDPETARIAGRFRYPVVHALYALILVPSALWMPLTFAQLEDPSDGLWVLIRVVLALVGFGSLGLLAALSLLRPRGAAWAFWLAVVGLVAFSLQTALLDALVWPAYFPDPAQLAPPSGT